MINRELIKGKLITYDDSTDEYGQINKGSFTEKEIQLTLKNYKHTKVEDIRFNDVTHISLTKERDINDSNKIKIGETLYSIAFVNDDGRLSEIFLKRDKE